MPNPAKAEIPAGEFAPWLRNFGERIKDNSPTPKWLMDKLNDEFHFDYDPCSINPSGLRAYDGLGGKWGTRTFVNPPFSTKAPWIKKAVEEQGKGKLVVMLLPVDTSTGWFHDFVLPNAEIRYLRGRLKSDGGKSPWRFASMVVIFRPKLSANEEAKTT